MVKQPSILKSKGQLILKCLSGMYLQFSQKMNEKIWLYHYGTSSRIIFICFLGELKTPKDISKSTEPLEEFSRYFPDVHPVIDTYLLNFCLMWGEKRGKKLLLWISNPGQ